MTQMTLPTEYLEALDCMNFWHQCCLESARTGLDYTGENIARWSHFADDALEYAMALPLGA